MIKIKEFISNNYISFSIGLLLFLIYSLYAFLRIIRFDSQILDLKSELVKLNFKNDVLNLENQFNIKYLRTYLPKFKLNEQSNHDFSSDSIREHKKSIILLLVGNCGACFENERPIWNNLYHELKSERYYFLAINLSSNEDIIKRYFNQNSLAFPIVDGFDFSNEFKTNSPIVEIITLVVDEYFLIEKIHLSFLGDEKRTESFKNNLTKSLKNRSIK